MKKKKIQRQKGQDHKRKSFYPPLPAATPSPKHTQEIKRENKEGPGNYQLITVLFFLGQY